MTCQLNSCCFCVSLRLGSFIIAYVNLVGGVLVFISSILLFISVTYILQGLPNTYWSDIVIICFLGIHMVLSFISLLFTVGMLVGIHKYQHKYILPGLIYHAVFLVFNVIDLIVLIAIGGITAGDIVVNIIAILITVYLLLVVRSYWFILKTDGPPVQSGIVFGPQIVQNAPGSYPQPVGYPVPAGYPAPAGYLAPAGYPAPAGYQAPPGYPAPMDYSKEAPPTTKSQDYQNA